MDALKKIYPSAFKAKAFGNLLVAIVIYVLIDFVCGLVIGFLSNIPLLGMILSIVGSVVGIYALVGIILSILVFIKVLK